MSEESTLHPALLALIAGRTPAMRRLGLDVRIAAPDLRPFLGGDGLPGKYGASSRRPPGRMWPWWALVHGNEIGGAVVLDRWLRAGLRPSRGRLSLIFANIDAYGRFDPEDPTASRFLDEDLDGLWDHGHAGRGARRSSELRRARVLRPLIDSIDIMLDLHSMLWPSDPLMLGGPIGPGGGTGDAHRHPAPGRRR